MKRYFRIFFCLGVFVNAFPLAALADAEQMPPDKSSKELTQIKSLAGRWKSTTSMFGKPNETVFTEFAVTANGSAVVERIFPGTPHEMLSVYYDDENGKLAMTHYCIMRNRPNLSLVKSKGDTLVMDVVKVDGAKSADDPSMGAVTIQFKDKDHFASTCEGKGKGSEKQKPMTMEYTRVQ